MKESKSMIENPTTTTIHTLRDLAMAVSAAPTFPARDFACIELGKACANFYARRIEACDLSSFGWEMTRAVRVGGEYLIDARLEKWSA